MKPSPVATPPIAVTAAGASLRGVRRRHLDQQAAGADRLVGELATQLAPALGKNRAVETTFLRHPYTGLSDRAAGRPGHARYVKDLDRDNAVFLDDLGREVVKEVLADARLSRTELGDRDEHAPVAGRGLALAW